MRLWIKGFLYLILVAIFWILLFTPFTKNVFRENGEKIDSLNGVFVHYNGRTGNVFGRNVTVDNYNLGLKYQCVEFVKRYYYSHYNHKMPNSYGHAKEFYHNSLKDGDLNDTRNLVQFSNPSGVTPKVGDLIIFSPTLINKYGHVAIISAVREGEVEVIQQNPGLFGDSREQYNLVFNDGTWSIENSRVLGWLRMK